MKAFWNKICRIFGVKSKRMAPVSSPQIKTDMPEEKKSTFVRLAEKFLDKVFKNEHDSSLISKPVAEILADDSLAEQFNKQLRKGQTSFTIKKGDKNYTFKQIK